jgi:hypothetical protein
MKPIERKWFLLVVALAPLATLFGIYAMQGSSSTTHVPGAPSYQEDGQPWSWDESAERLSREKEAVAAVLLEPDRVEACRVELPPERAGDMGSYGSYRIVCQAKPVTRGVTARLAAILLDPRSYLSQSTKACEFTPSVVFRFWKREEFLDVVICLSCNQLLIVEQDPAVPFQLLGAFQARFRVGGDFDPALGYVRLLVKKSFPDVL